MSQKKLPLLFLEQSDDLIWIIDSNFKLVYANPAFLSLIKSFTGSSKELNKSIFIEGFGGGQVERWRDYYSRALSGETFEIEEHFTHPVTNEKKYTQVFFKPILDKDGPTGAVSCQSKDVTEQVKRRLEANRLLNATLDVFCTIDEEGNFSYLNDACIKLWGYTPKELQNIPYRSLILEEDLAKTDAIASEIVKGTEIRTFVNRYRRKDGGIAYNLWSAKWNREEKLMYCVARDGKEHVEKEEILLKSEQRFKTLVQEGSDLIAILDAEGNYVYVSPTSIPVLGIKPEDLIGRSPFEFIHPNDVERTKASLQRIFTEKRINVEPFRFRNHKKEWRWIETVLTNMIDDEVVNGIVANSKDITERIEEERKLRLLETVIINAKDAILITEAEPLDEPGPRIIYANEAFTKMTGYTSEELLGKTPRILQGPNSDYGELEKLSTALRNYEPYEMTTINYKKNGEEFWINFSVSPVKDETGLCTHFVSVERDVTEQQNKIIEKELLSKINLVFNQESDLTTIGEELCKTLSGFGEFDLVELWIPNLSGSEIQLYSHCFINEKNGIFYDLSKEYTTFKYDEGLPGHVWKSKKAILWKNEDLSEVFVRKKAAEKIGLNAVLGIPLLHNKNLVGVLVLGSTAEDTRFKQHMPIIERLQTIIGSEINRKRLETDLNRLFNSVPELISTGDFQGRFLQINRAGCELLGYDEKEIVGAGFEKFIHPDDLAKCYKELEVLELGASTFDFQVRFITKQGKIIWLSWYCLTDFKEGVIYSAAKNITEEKKLKQLNNQAYDLAKVGSWGYDLIKDDLFWSDEVHRLHETDPNTFEPNIETAIDFYKEEHKSYVADEIYKSLNEGVYLDYEAVIVSKSKKEKWVRVIGSPEFIEEKCVKFIGSFQDTTDRRKAESRLKNLSDNIPGVVFLYLLHPDGSDEFKYVSKGSEKILGYSPEEVTENIDLVWNQVKAGGDYEAVKQSISESVENKSQWSMRIRIVTTDGEKRILQGLGTPEFLSDGTVQFNSVVLDITQESRNQELLDDVANLTKMGTWEASLVNKTVFWSDETHRIHETDPSTFQPEIDKAINFYREDYRDLVKSKFEECMITGEAYDIEAVVITTSSKERWVRTTGKAEIVNGVCTRVYGSFQDITEQKIAQKELKSITERHQIAKEAASIGIFDWDISQNKLIWDEKMYEIFNVNPAEFNGAYQAWEATVHPDDIEQANKDVENAINGVSEFDSNFRIIWKDKSIHYIKANASIERDENGKAVRMVGTNWDITKEKIAEKQVLLALQEKNNILESIGDAFFAVDKNWTITYWNKKAESVMGRTREGIIGQNLWDVFPDATDLEFYRQLHAAVKTGEKVNFEEFHPELNLWLDVSAYPSKEGLSVYFKDVTQRKKSEEERNKLQKTLENSLNEIYIFDSATFQFSYINKGALHNLGYSAKEITELTPLDLKPEYTLSSFRDLITPLLRKEKERIIFFTNHQRKDGSLYPVEVHLQLIDDGLNKNFVAIILDITERKNQEKQLLALNESLQSYAEELERSNEELEQFAFITSHDLQEPLRMITGFMNQLERKYGDQLDDKAHRYIHFATDGAKRMKNIITDLLEYSRAGRASDSMELIDLPTLILEYKQLRRKIIAEKSVVISTDSLGKIYTDKIAITQVFHVLLDNAIKYSKEGTTPVIEIAMEELKNEWKFIVKDNGIGIEPKFFDKIFVIFQRLHNRNEYGGTGIGLAIAKKHVEFLGGKIWLRSTVGEGTSFYFTIPKI